MTAEPPRREVAVSLVEELVAEQFPRWAGLPVRPVEPGGWDNRTFRLGEALSVRLPSAERYAAQVEKEHRWLPRLARYLPLAIPESLATGTASRGFPWPWSVRRWIDGEVASRARVADTVGLAVDLAGFLAALHAIDPAGGPPPGPHGFFRGASPAVYDGETRQALGALRGQVDTERATSTWREALESRWDGSPVWIHGDVAASNLLVRDGRLHAVIDFGGCAVGDPACDLTIAWTFFSGKSRDAFREALPLDAATWARARGWALWKALITLAGRVPGDGARQARRVMEAVIADAGR